MNTNSAKTSSLPRVPLSLRFSGDLEKRYQIQRHEWLKNRAQAVAWFALAVNLAYCLSDLSLLPIDLSAMTIAVRVVIMSPPVVLILWALRKEYGPRAFMRVYAAAYVIAGLGIVAIIAIARWHEIALPYEGLLLMTMFGYLIMGLPFNVAVLASLLLFATYVAVEGLFLQQSALLAFNVFFLFTTNVIGAVGAFLQEKNHRSQFLLRREAQRSQRQAEQENAAKTRLLAAASHDLRQPLHAMNLQLENLRASLDDAVEGAQLDALGNSLEQLNHLLGALLDLSRLEAGVVQPYPTHFELTALLRALVTQQSIEAGPQLVMSMPSAPVWVHTDRAMLARIVSNLLDNARRHAGASEVEISLTQEGARWRLAVKDDGCGIRDSDRARIFEEFSRAGGGGGLGLGLAIVRRTAALLNMPLNLDSQQGRGACFSLELEQVAEPAQHAPSEAEPGAALTGCTIVVVDDEPEVLNASRSLLQTWQMEVLIADTFDKALRLLSRHPNALLLSDIHLDSTTTGIDLLATARSQGFQGGALFWTADSSFSLSEKRKNALAPMLWVQKPLRPAKLKRMLLSLGDSVNQT